MAGLNDIDEKTPSGTASPREGDNEIRALKAKIKEFAFLEHNYDGSHKFPRGPLAERPADGNEGRFFILTTPGLPDELQYDDGAAWVTLTSNQALLSYLTGLSDHIAASPIDHPDESITEAKIAKGHIKKKHLDGSNDNASVAALVDGSNADGLHAHNFSSTNIADGSVSQLKLFAVTAGDYVLHENAAEKSTTSLVPDLVKETVVAQKGTYRVKFDLRNNEQGSFYVYAQIYKNGVAAGVLYQTYSATPVTYSDDIPNVNPGDLIQVKAYVTNTGYVWPAAFVSNLRICVAQPIVPCSVL